MDHEYEVTSLYLHNCLEHKSPCFRIPFEHLDWSSQARTHFDLFFWNHHPEFSPLYNLYTWNKGFIIIKKHTRAHTHSLLFLFGLEFKYRVLGFVLQFNWANPVMEFQDHLPSSPTQVSGQISYKFEGL